MRKRSLPPPPKKFYPQKWIFMSFDFWIIFPVTFRMFSNIIFKKWFLAWTLIFLMIYYTRSVFDLIPIPIIITILIFVLITNQPAHNSQVDRLACIAWMSMVMRMKNGNGFEIEYWPLVVPERVYTMWDVMFLGNTEMELLGGFPMDIKLK